MLLENPVLTAYAATSTVLALHTMSLAVSTALARVKARKVVNQEDSATVSKGADVVPVEPEAVLRTQRAHRNAIENIVPYFVVAGLYAMTGPSATAAWVYFGVYVATRILHSFFYLNAIQPWRTAMFAIGSLAVLGMAVHVLRAAMS
jgi:glutathione S-transferase